MSVAFWLPWPPASNHYRIPVRGRLILSSAARAYYERCAVVLLAQGVPRGIVEPVELEIIAHQPDRRRRDLDGLLKQPLDALTKHGLWDDDSRVHALAIRWGEPEAGGLLRCRLWPLLPGAPPPPVS